MMWDPLKSLRQDYYEGLVRDIERLEEGDVSCLYLVYSVFALDDEELARRGAKAIKTALVTYDMQRMIRLSERFRQYTSMEWWIEWKDIRLKRWKGRLETEEDYFYALILGSFHPNGYFREACVTQLEGYENTLPYLLLRVNDWVKLIRLKAGGMARKRIKICPLRELMTATQALDKVTHSGRREDRDLEEIREAFEERLHRDIADLPLWEISGYAYSIRKSIYRLLMEQRILDLEKTEFLLNRDRHSFCQLLLITGIFKYYDCSMEMIDKYLKHRTPKVRQAALEYKMRHIKGDWPGLEDLLLDTSRGIREMAAFLLQKYRDMDIPGFYVKHLTDENPVVPILGLGETGTRETADRLLAFLEWETEKVVRSALKSLSRLLEGDGEDLYWTYLLDERNSVSKAAYLAARNNRVSYGAKQLYEQFLISEREHVSRYLLLLLLNVNTWKSLPYLICLCQDKRAENDKNKILGSMWSRNNYTQISRKQAQDIERALEDGKEALPEELVKGIRFDLKFVTV